MFSIRQVMENWSIEEALIQVDDAGIITKVTAKQIKGMRQSWQKHQRIFRLYLKASALPGFVDLHVHAPQWPQAGIALDEPLNVWLDECTFHWRQNMPIQHLPKLSIKIWWRSYWQEERQRFFILQRSI